FPADQLDDLGDPAHLGAVSDQKSLPGVRLTVNTLKCRFRNDFLNERKWIALRWKKLGCTQVGHPDRVRGSRFGISNQNRKVGREPANGLNKFSAGTFLHRKVQDDRV